MSKELTPDRSSQIFRPSDFMRARRPQLFSDSVEKVQPQLSREVFEYHLDTLTSRKEETKFEHFARKLAEKEICPNLLPQTGPTGGGDSKVDTETYPVSEDVARRWYEGDANAARERWAFAFSAKKDWAAKVRKDVANIASTGRGYALIYFVTNQFAPDKRRAELEDELKKEHGIPVRIVDRTWIVEKVFGNDRIRLAIETLGLTDLQNETGRAVGPNDHRRQQELSELDAQLADPDRYQGVDYQLAEDCLESALLARGLERPRNEVDGRFDRAERVAGHVAMPSQQLRIAYARAWTALWWYDDFAELNRLYSIVEGFAKGSAQAEDLELLFNLWQLLLTAVRQRQLPSDQAAVAERATTLKTELGRLAANEGRPNNAASARTDRALVDLIESMGDKDGTTRALRALKEIVLSVDGLIDYPIDRLNNLLREIGDAYADNETYDDLFEAITSLVEKRRGEGAAGEALRQRGFQKLRAELPYEAIRLFGRAQQKLAKREYRGELVGTLVGIGLAYEDVGLLWAARSSVMAGANYALSEFWENGSIVRPAVRCVHKLIWIEMQLGRLPLILEWIRLSDALAAHLNLDEDDRKDFAEKRQNADMVLALLLAKARFADLPRLEFLPNVLEQLQLPHSWTTLLYVLGHEDKLRAEGWIPPSETSEAVHDLFRKLLEQPANDDLPAHPDLCDDADVTLRSRVLGCSIIVAATNRPHTIQLAETILGALESLLSTSLDTGVFPHREELNITVAPAPKSCEGPYHEVQEADTLVFKVFHGESVQPTSAAAREKVSDWLLQIVFEILTRIAVIRDPEAYMKRIAGDEEAMARAFSFADFGTFASNILGSKPRLKTSDWKPDVTGASFPLRRDGPWNPPDENASAPDSEPRKLKFGTGEPPPHLLNTEGLKHPDRAVRSLIDIPKWDKAGWTGTVFMVVPNSDAPPVFALAFRGREAAVAIFKDWIGRLTNVDREERLRIAILTGIEKANPAAYRVVVGTNLELEQRREGQIVTVSRMNTMTPANSKNLDIFMEQYRRVGAYLLVPAHFSDLSKPPEVLLDLRIGKRALNVRPLWEVGENDPDMVGVQEEDDPIVPEAVKDAPVYAALARKRQRSRK